jgi:hypothetical protein
VVPTLLQSSLSAPLFSATTFVVSRKPAHFWRRTVGAVDDLDTCSV